MAEIVSPVRLELFKDGALQAWYTAAEPALLRNKTLREFLSLYTDAQRPEMVKLTLLHGVLCLHKSFGHKRLSVTELRRVVEAGQYAIAIEDGVGRYALQTVLLIMQYKASYSVGP